MKSPQEILDLPMQDNDSGADTIRGYLAAILAHLWSEGECFSGKRPFGNSGWQFDLYLALVKEGVIEGTIDDDGFLEECDDDAGRQIIARCIEVLGLSKAI